MENIDIINAAQGTPEWLEVRRSGIGGSEAAAILGVSKYNTPLDIYMQKINGSHTPDNEAMLWGRVLEPVIRDQYAERTGRKVLDTHQIVRSKKHPFMLASLDGVTEDNRLLEIKTTRFPDNWGEEGSDEIPDNYLVQVQHYMAVTGLQVADIAVLIGGSDFRLYEVEADKELQQILINQEKLFWNNLKEGNAPDPFNAEDVALLYKHSKEGEVEADNLLYEKIEQLKNVQAQQKSYAAEEKEIKTAIQLHMGEYDTLTYQGKKLCTWKSSKPSKRFDSKSFKADYPGMYADYCIEGTASRRFLVK
tara:strand:- start:29849 stop:30766 length:918 start_codon:yes stop_codon:yes gene_type:complete